MKGMEVKYLLMADHASADSGGKISMLGLFGVVRANGFPYTLNRMYVVSSLVFPPNEAGSRRKLSIKLLGEDGKVLLVLGPNEFEVPRSQTPGMSAEIPIIMEVNGLTFTEAGLHSWKVEINDDTKASLSLQVIDISGQAVEKDEGN